MSSVKKGTFLGDPNRAFIIRLLPFCTSTKDKEGMVGGCSLSILGIWEIHLPGQTSIYYIGSPIPAIINSRALFSPFPDLVLITTACNLGLWTARGNELPSCVKPPKNCSKSPEKNCSLTIRASVARNSTLASAPKKVFKTCAGKKWRSTLKSVPRK